MRLFEVIKYLFFRLFSSPFPVSDPAESSDDELVEMTVKLVIPISSPRVDHKETLAIHRSLI